MSFPIPSIYSSVVGKLTLPAAGTYALELPDLSIPIIKLDAADEVDGTDEPKYEQAPPSQSPIFSEKAQTAGYVATTDVIAFINPDAAIEPSYSEAFDVPALVYQAAEGAPTKYPEGSQITIDEDSGITPQIAPKILFTDRPKLLKILVDGFIETEVDLFDVTSPVAEAPDIEKLEDLDELELSRDYDALIDSLNHTLSGEPVFDITMRKTMFSHADIDLKETSLIAEQKVMADSAARGFSLPTGDTTGKMLEINKTLALARIKVLEDIRDENYKRTKDLLDMGVRQSMVLERKHASIQLNFNAKLLEVQKYNVKMHVTLFDSLVAVFNAKLKVLNVQVGAYSAYIRAVLEQHSGHNAELGAISAEVGTYKADVDARAAQISSLESMAREGLIGTEEALLKVKEYEAYMGAVDNNIKMVKLNLDAYRTAVDAYSKSIDNDVAYVSAYAEYVGAQSAKVQVSEANIQSYSSFWSAEKARTGYYENWASATSSVISAEMAEYKDYVAAYRSYIATMSDKVSASVRAINTYISSVDTTASYTSAYNRAYAAWNTFDMSVDLNNAEIKLVQDTLRTSAEVAESRIEASKLGATVTIQAGLAQAAYSVIGTSVSVNANANASNSASDGGSLNTVRSLSRSYSHSRSKSLSV